MSCSMCTRIIEQVKLRPGMTRTEIAEELDISLNIVFRHTRSILSQDELATVGSGPNERFYP